MESPSVNTSPVPPEGRKRKSPEDGVQQLEIDINAPEPASRKELRKAKRLKASVQEHGEEFSSKPTKVLAEQSANEQDLEASDRATSLSNRSPHSIWIGNLSFTTTKESLRTFFTKPPAADPSASPISTSEITRIHLPSGRPIPSGKSQNKGFAYVDFASASAASLALTYSEGLLGGRRVLIKLANNFTGRPDPKLKLLGPESAWSRRIFVGNLDFSVTKEDVEKHFGVCGSVRDVHVATFEESGKCKGYAWVEYEEIEAAKAAMMGSLPSEPTSRTTTISDTQPDDTTAETLQPKKAKKIPINRMGTRKLRMEFAEDKATRYEKRFGKAASNNNRPSPTSHTNPNESKTVTANPQTHDDLLDRPSRSTLNGESSERPLDPADRRRQQQREPPVTRTGYTETAIQKLTGGILAATGKKVVFD